MKTRLLCMLGLLCGYAGSAVAEPLAILSGEHDTFTRLVSPLAGSRDFEIVQQGQDVILTLGNHTDGFGTRSVFDRIRKDRIGQLTSSSNQLTLSLVCDCVVASFEVQGPYLVLDVAEKGTRLEGDIVPQQSVLPPPEPPPEQVAEVVPKDLPAAVAPPPPEPERATPTAIVPAPVIPLLPQTVRRVDPALNFPQPALDRAGLQTVDRQVLEDMQDQLARELGGAATAGVLTPAPGRALPTPSGSRTETAAAPPPEPEPITTDAGPLANVRISSSLDRPTRDHANTLNIAGLSCPPEGVFDLASWGNSDSFAMQISEARQGLYGELDRLDHRVATQLAQRYLYFGFGAEARQILELDAALVQTQGALLLVADIMDGLPPGSGVDLLRNPDCEADVVLWAALAKPEPVQGAKPDADAALRALNELPVHLRQILAPMLSQKLLAFGDAKGAAQALRSLERQPDPLQSAAKLAQAELDLHNGKTRKGTAKLEEVADENSVLSPAALIALVDAKLAAEQPISSETAELLAAYAHELDGTEQGPKLRRAHVLALLKSGHFDEAFEASHEINAQDHPALTKDLRNHFLRELAAAADDIVFLDHIFAQDEAVIAQLSPVDLHALAQRFLTTGFADRAEQTLAYVDEQNRQDRDRLLAAEIALALGKPHQAQASLLGMNDDQAQRLRADASRLAGAHDEAHDLYMQTDQLDPAAETAWLAENWQGLTTAETPVFGPASQLAAYSNEAPLSVEGMLARSAAALDESAAARQTLADLLGAEVLQVQPDN